jgi:hypothetical protein
MPRFLDLISLSASSGYEVTTLTFYPAITFSNLNGIFFNDGKIYSTDSGARIYSFYDPLYLTASPTLAVRK